MPVKLFFCYAHEDEPLLNKLKSQLSPLRRQGLIEMWHDRDINAGTKWEEEIDQHLNEANIILFLVSPDFMDSDYCYGKEMQRALERDQRGEARVIPIILRPAYWQGVLGRLQALPTDAKPIMSSSWQYQDEALFDVTKGIHKVVEELIAQYHVLVVDDSIFVRRFVENLLKKNGWKVQSARDGVEAMKMLLRETPGAIILNIDMPRMDGFELIATMRLHDRYHTLPLVVLSSHGSREYQERAMQLGANAYLVKPCQGEELPNILKTLIYSKNLTS